MAVWREYGSPAMCQSSPHRAHQETLQQWHRLLRKTQCPESRWGVDGWIQIPCLHGLEHPHERKFFSVLDCSLNPWAPLAFSLPYSLAYSDMQSWSRETLVNRNSKFRFHPIWPSHCRQSKVRARKQWSLTPSRWERFTKWRRGDSFLISLFSYTSV